MINILKKLLFVSILLLFSGKLLAFTSSSFLISQYAFKNHDYSVSLSNLAESKTLFDSTFKVLELNLSIKL